MNILLPSDFSDHSLNACAYAVDLFGPADNMYILVHSYHDPLPGYEAMVEMTSGGYTDAVEDMMAFVARFHDLPGAKDAVIVTEVVKGALTSRLAGVCKAKAADVVVMGTQGASGLLLFGSNASGVARTSPVPVLIVPKDARYKGLERILLGDDHTPMDPSSMALLLQIARRTKADITIAHVRDRSGSATDPLIIADHDAVLADVPHSYVEASGDGVAQVLSGLAERIEADMVAVLHRHLGALEGLFHTSTSQRLAMHGHVPLLVLEH